MKSIRVSFNSNHETLGKINKFSSIKAVTKTGHADIQIQDDLQKHEHILPPNRRNRCKKKKSTKRSPHQLAAYNTSDRKAAITVGVIMGVFLGERAIEITFLFVV